MDGRQGGDGQGERDAAGVWQVIRNVQLPVSDFSGLQSIALGGTTENSVGFVGPNAVAWMPLAGDNWEYVELDGYETPIKDAHLNDVVSGDLNNDGFGDIVMALRARILMEVTPERAM